jgi:hypothetical protein
MISFLRRNFIPALLACVVVFTIIPFGESLMRVYSYTQSAIEWHGVEVVTKTVKPGGILELVYTLTVHRQCPADLRGFIVAPDNTVPIRMPIVAGGYVAPSDDPVRLPVKIFIPQASDAGLAPLKSGPHIYRSTATRYCHDGVEQDSNIPDAPFMLEVPQ